MGVAVLSGVAVALLWLLADRRQRLRELRECRSRLREESAAAESGRRAKETFLAVMSHEVRTPMSGIIGMTNLLMETRLSRLQEEYLETIRTSADSLLTVLSDVLDFARAEAGRIELEEIDFDPRDAIEDVMEFLAPRARAKRLELAYLVSHGVPDHLRGDPGRIRQILSALIGNAVKFTEEGEVTLVVSAKANEAGTWRVLFEVADTGVGIPPEQQETIFAPFRQSESFMVRRHGGTGLGLAICQGLVRRMGGTIRVESELDRGSTFRVALDMPSGSPPPPSATPEPDRLPGLRLLVVGGLERPRELLHRKLVDWGLDVVTAADGEDALHHIRQAHRTGSPFRVVVIDLSPGEDSVGRELARAIRAEPAARQSRLLLLATVGIRGDASIARSLGYGAYLVKPASDSRLRACLAALADSSASSTASTLVTRHSLREAHERRRPRVLVVEESLIHRKAAVRLLENRGCRTDVACTGLEALAAVERHAYDLILAGDRLPEIDGCEVARRLRRRGPQVRRAPIVGLVSSIRSGARERCLEAGMDDCVERPITEAALQKLLDRWLRPPKAPRGDGRASGSVEKPARTTPRSKLKLVE